MTRFCVTECTHRKYGDGCRTDCGHCKDMVQCNHVDGVCPNGCEPGYTQDNCTQRTTMIRYQLLVVGQTKQIKTFLYIRFTFMHRKILICKQING